ncbi:MAG TPA: AraC family transcriptional regulator [Polyangiales bacterium]|nr:AraC family transcriptional regulator [Polyangiales bacterium]
MATLSKPSSRDSSRDFQSLFRHARRHVSDGAGDVREIRLELEGPPLSARSWLLSWGGLLFVLGENQADEDLTLRHEAAPPLVAVHAPLRGNAATTMDALATSLSERAGALQLFVSPSSHSTVRLRARVKNQAFRIAFSPAWVRELAARHSELEPLAEHLASGAPFCGKPINAQPLQRVLDEANQIMDSAHYGTLRPLFLESRALSWLAMALAGAKQSEAKRPHARAIERMHEARELLLSRIADPPTLAEVAAAVGTNDFDLKRNFKAVFGQPVYGYLLRVRLAHARCLLEDTDDSIKEIAAAVGYAHPNHFSTAFGRAYGVSPAQHRATARR